jgi:cold shock CspA family protein
MMKGEAARIISRRLNRAPGRPTFPTITLRLMATGTLVRYLDDRGFGFIAIGRGTDVDRAYFAHITEFHKAGVDIPRVGDAYEFEIAERHDGKLRAINLRAVDVSD